MQKKVFVTGASGFIGKYVIDELCRQNTRILALDRNCNGFNLPNISYCSVNLLNKEDISRSLIEFQPDAVIHLAAIAAPVHNDVAEIYNINVHGSEVLLDAIKATCQKETRVILTSTAGVYGNSSKEYINEETEYNPQNHYSFSKMVMEYISKAYKDDLDIRIVRPFNMIGRGQRDNFLIPKLVNAFVTKQEILQVGNLDTMRDYVNVDYAAKIFTELALQDNPPYSVLNICSGHGVKGIEILDILEEITNYRPKIEVNPQFLRKNEIMRLVGEPSKCNSFVANKFKLENIKEILKVMVG